MENLEKILSKIPDKNSGNGSDYVKSKAYFTLNIGTKVGERIRDLKKICRENNKRIPNDIDCLRLLYPKVEQSINSIEENIEKIEEFLTK